MERAAVDEGFKIVFDGDGGDELFDVWNRVGDLLHERAWRCAARWLLSRRSPWRALWNEILSPNLPEPIRDTWLAIKKGRSAVDASWMTQEFREMPAVRIALRDEARFASLWTTRSALPTCMESGGVTARLHSKRLSLASLGLESASPLWDRRIVEFVLRLPAALRVHPLPKIFLRRACESRLPVLNAAHSKDITWYLDVRRRGLLASWASAVIRDLSRREHPLARWVDARAAESLRSSLATGAPEHDDSGRQTSQLYALLYLADWTKLVSRLEFP
jgi:asparagine synthetase B (glutamine-hydrolysing)